MELNLKLNFQFENPKVAKIVNVPIKTELRIEFDPVSDSHTTTNLATWTIPALQGGIVAMTVNDTENSSITRYSTFWNT